MRGAMLGAMAVCGAGGAAYVGVGGGPNDYVGIVNRSPQAVYSAFAASMGPEGITSLPSRDGWPGEFSQRVSKTAPEEVRLELVAKGTTIVTIEIDFAAEGEGATRVAGEIDIDSAAMAQLADAEGADAMAMMAMGDGLIDMAFANAMGEMVEDVERGRPLANFAALSRGWGDSNSRVRSRANNSGDYRGERIRPDASTRPMVDPNAAARRHAAGGQPGSSGGWGSQR